MLVSTFVCITEIAMSGSDWGNNATPFLQIFLQASVLQCTSGPLKVVAGSRNESLF